MLAGNVFNRPRWPLHALDTTVVGLFVVVGALKTQDAGLPGGATILLATITGISGGGCATCSPSRRSCSSSAPRRTRSSRCSGR